METSTGSSAATANGRFTVDAEKARRLEARMMGGGTMGDEENSRAEMEQVVSPAAFPLLVPGLCLPTPCTTVGRPRSLSRRFHFAFTLTGH